jgi:hypothetical protein
MAELLWRDTYHLHGALLQSAKSCLADDGIIFVSFVNRTAVDDDRSSCDDFFKTASSDYGFTVNEIAKYQRKDVCSSGLVDVYLMTLRLAS